MQLHVHVHIAPEVGPTLSPQLSSTMSWWSRKLPPPKFVGSGPTRGRPTATTSRASGSTTPGERPAGGSACAADRSGPPAVDRRLVPASWTRAVRT